TRRKTAFGFSSDVVNSALLCSKQILSKLILYTFSTPAASAVKDKRWFRFILAYQYAPNHYFYG
ncbi:MAG: hypothetical protein AAB457_02365, partial [Patescibacteria group bacterium]